MEKYLNIEYISQNWLIYDKYDILEYLERNKLITYKNGVRVYDITTYGLFKCRDGVERVVYVYMNSEHYILREFWIKLMKVGKHWSPSILDKINYKYINNGGK